MAVEKRVIYLNPHEVLARFKGVSAEDLSEADRQVLFDAAYSLEKYRDEKGKIFTQNPDNRGKVFED